MKLKFKEQDIQYLLELTDKERLDIFNTLLNWGKTGIKMIDTRNLTNLSKIFVDNFIKDHQAKARVAANVRRYVLKKKGVTND